MSCNDSKLTIDFDGYDNESTKGHEHLREIQFHKVAL